MSVTNAEALLLIKNSIQELKDTKTNSKSLRKLKEIKGIILYSLLDKIIEQGILNREKVLLTSSIKFLDGNKETFKITLYIADNYQFVYDNTITIFKKENKYSFRLNRRKLYNTLDLDIKTFINNKNIFFNKQGIIFDKVLLDIIDKKLSDEQKNFLAFHYLKSTAVNNVFSLNNDFSFLINDILK